MSQPAAAITSPITTQATMPWRADDRAATAADDVPDAFWKSLGLFNLSRMVLAGVLLAAILIYRDGRVFGASNPTLFYQTVITYFCLSLAFGWALKRVRTVFAAHLAVQAVTDIVVVALLLHASGGIRSGLGILLLMPLAAAASVSRGRMSLFFASLATFALLVENTWWVLQFDTGLTDYFPSGLMAAGCFAVSLVTNRLARRLVLNEELVRKRSADLRSQLEINRLVIRDMPSGVLAVTADGRVSLSNPEAERLLGQSDLTGRSLRELAGGLADAAMRWRTVSGPASPSLRIAGRELQIRMHDAAGEEKGDLVIFLEDTNKLREHAQQAKLAALGRLTANIAHEIRNPLSAINHAAELLREETGESGARLTRIITENAARLDRIVGEVLELNRRDRAQAESIDLGTFLQHFADQIVASERVPAAAFRLHFPVDTQVLFDRQHLHQILWNLVTNAWRHSRQQPGSVQIVVTRNAAAGTSLHVTDDGPGIPRQDAGQLFEPFFTTAARGTGLGLYIARELAAANGAALESMLPDARDPYIAQMTGLSGADFRLLFGAPLQERRTGEPRTGEPRTGEPRTGEPRTSVAGAAALQPPYPSIPMNPA